MKYIYIIIALIVAIGGFFIVTSLMDTKEVVDEIPEGYHRMSDGTLMRNDVGTEGMGALSELQENMTQEESDMEMTIDPNAKVFEVRGVNYEYDVKEIRVKKGETVTINFESTDGFHDWVLDEFNVNTDRVQPGTKTSVTFVAEEAGTFEYYCSVGNHRAHGMVGKLIVEE